MNNSAHEMLVETICDAINKHPHYCAKERKRALDAKTEAEHTEIYDNILSLPEFVAKELEKKNIYLSPCSVGDTVYSLTFATCENTDGKHTVCEYYNPQNDNLCSCKRACPHMFRIEPVVVTYANIMAVINNWGKTVFKTEEEALKKASSN